MDLGLVLIGVAAFAAAVAVLYVLITRLTRAAFGPRRHLEAELGLEALEQRLARGEITRAEFEQARRAGRVAGFGRGNGSGTSGTGTARR